MANQNQITPSPATKALVHGIVCMLGGVLLGLAISKHSVPTAFKTGYEHAFKIYGHYYPKQVKYFEEHVDRACMVYWFGGKSRVNEARKWMCQYTNNDGSMK
jgi:hypothetical protein